MGFLDEIPFVYGNNYRSSGFLRVATDMSVEGRHAFDTVNDQNCHIAALQMTPGHDDAELFRLQFGLSFTPNPCSINKSDGQVVMMDNDVDRIAGCTGDGRDHGPLLADQFVEERGLADVRTANNRYPDFANRIFFRF